MESRGDVGVLEIALKEASVSSELTCLLSLLFQGHWVGSKAGLAHTYILVVVSSQENSSIWYLPNLCSSVRLGKGSCLAMENGAQREPFFLGMFISCLKFSILCLHPHPGIPNGPPF